MDALRPKAQYRQKPAAARPLPAAGLALECAAQVLLALCLLQLLRCWQRGYARHRGLLVAGATWNHLRLLLKLGG